MHTDVWKWKDSIDLSSTSMWNVYFLLQLKKYIEDEAYPFCWSQGHYMWKVCTVHMQTWKSLFTECAQTGKHLFSAWSQTYTTSINFIIPTSLSTKASSKTLTNQHISVPTTAEEGKVFRETVAYIIWAAHLVSCSY